MRRAGIALWLLVLSACAATHERACEGTETINECRAAGGGAACASEERQACEDEHFGGCLERELAWCGSRSSYTGCPAADFHAAVDRCWMDEVVVREVACLCDPEGM